MRVATYTERTAPTRGSMIALVVLLLTILLGSGVVPTVAFFLGGVFPQLMTPLWLLLYLAAFLGLMFTYGINWISWLVRYRLLLVVLMIGTIMSVAWSIDAKVSAERVVHLLGSSLIAVYIGFAIPLLSTLRIFAVVLGVLIVASILAAVGLPALGIESYEGIQVWRGVFNSKNDLGFWACAGVLLYITLSESSHSLAGKSTCFIMALACLGLLVLSQSATSLIALLLAGALVLYLYIAGRFQLGFIRMVFIAVCFIGLTVLAIGNIDTNELVGRTDDLTGRGEVWEQVLKLIFDYPLTGVGYGSLWFPTDDTIWIQQSLFEFTWTVFHAHNGLLQIASEVGIPLALIAILMVAQQLIEMFYCQYERQQVGVLFVLGFAVAYLTSNYSEARFLVTRELFWIFFLALPISMLRQINLVNTQTQEATDPGYGDQPDTSMYAGVPGKPWLSNAADEIHAGGREAPLMLTGAAGQAASLKEEAAADSGHDDIDVELGHSTLSLSEADIDLGKPVKKTDTDNSNSVVDENADDFEFGANHGAASMQAAEASDNVTELFGHDDTFENDRYDLVLEVKDSWVDIDLDDGKKLLK